MNTTKTYYAGITQGEVVCLDCAGHHLATVIKANPNHKFLQGAEDTYTVLPHSEAAELFDLYGSVCYCSN